MRQPAFGSEDTLETNRVGLSRLLKVSVAQCARLSYRTFGGRPSTLEGG